MMRMADQIRLQKSVPTPIWFPTEYLGLPRDQFPPRAAALMRSMEDVSGLVHETISGSIAPIFDIQNVYEYEKDRTTKIYEDWPCLVSPLPWMWMEYHRGANDPTHVGAIVLDSSAIVEDAKNKDWQHDGTRENMKKLLSLHMFFMQKRTVVGPIATFDVAMDEGGRPIEFHWQSVPQLNVESGPVDVSISKVLLSKSAPFFAAIAFMHCKNVSYHKVLTEPKIARAYERRKKVSMVTFNRLTIDPLKATIGRMSGRGGDGSGERSLHIARGHFAEYGPEFGKGLLFGKYSGRFWIPAHVRGRSEIGTVLHDYEVKGGG